MTEDEKLAQVRKDNEEKRRREMPCPSCATASPDRAHDEDGMTCADCGVFYPWEMLYQRDAWIRFTGHAKVIAEKATRIADLAGYTVALHEPCRLLTEIEAEATFMRWAWDGMNQMRNNLGYPVYGSVVGDVNPLFAPDPLKAEHEAAKRKEKRDRNMSRHLASQKAKQ